jgi:predicted amidohydrolase
MATRASLLQANCAGSRQQNLATAERIIGDAAGKQAQVPLLPEVFHELFFITDLNSRYFEAAGPGRRWPLLRIERGFTRLPIVSLPGLPKPASPPRAA